jgi:hypothetical protein
MVMTLTLSAAASARIDGSSLPADQSPAAMRARICSMIWRYMGRASVWEIYMPLYILCIQCILSSEAKNSPFAKYLSARRGAPAPAAKVVRVAAARWRPSTIHARSAAAL